MFLCLAMCFSAYTFPKKIFFLKLFLVKSCGSLTAALQGGTFSFALSIPFTALPMHRCCTIYQADPSSFCFGGPH